MHAEADDDAGTETEADDAPTGGPPPYGSVEATLSYGISGP